MPYKGKVMKSKISPGSTRLTLQELHGTRRPPAGRGKLYFWTILAVLIVGGASFWLTRPMEERTRLTAEAGERVDSLLSGTPLAGLGSELAGTNPQIPQEVIMPPTDAGTLSGRQVTGTLETPVDPGPLLPLENVPPQEPSHDLRTSAHELAASLGIVDRKEEVVFSRDYVPPVTEDKTVTPGYLEGVATWLVNHYRETPRGGILTANVQSLNQECGGDLARSGGGRSRMLNYFFHAGMINGLYNLYIDRFMADLNAAASKKGFSERQTRQFHAALAGRAALLASALEGVIQIPDLALRLGRLDRMAQKTVDENADLASAIFALDELQEKRQTGTVLNAAQLRVDGAHARYRRAVEDYEKGQSALAQEIRKYSGPGLDEDTLLFIAAWAARRETGNGNAAPALRACVSSLRDLAHRCQVLGGVN